MKRQCCHLSTVLVLLSLLAGCGTPVPTSAPTPAALSPTPKPPEMQKLILATTTSTENSGLLAYLSEQSTASRSASPSTGSARLSELPDWVLRMYS